MSSEFEMGNISDTDSDVHKKRTEAFLNELTELCKKHKISIAHEDGWGAFLMRDYNSVEMQWMWNAFNELKTSIYE